MKQISVCWEILKEYILNNNLQIDKSMYFTVVIGQITIYGILLTFYQFVASYQGNQKTITRYLGTNVMEFFVKKNISFFYDIVSKKSFGTIFVLELLYKPLIAVYGSFFSTEMINAINFAWYMFVIFYFVLFIMLFFQCAKCTLMIKLSSDIKTNQNIINDINKQFLRKKVKERKTKSAIELLKKDFKDLRDAIQFDENPELQEKYDDLIYIIFKNYIEQKQYEVSIIENKGKIPKNQIAWTMNAECEAHLLQEIVEEKYFGLDKENIGLILRNQMILLRLNFKRAELAGYNELKCDKYVNFASEGDKKIFDASEWMDLTKKIYRKLSHGAKKNFIYSLQMNVGWKQEEKQNFYETYCKKYIIATIKHEMQDIAQGKQQQKDFVETFELIIREERMNRCFSQIIRDNVIWYKTFDAVEAVGLLSKENCTYVFAYLIMYYSIYKFRFDWEYINIKTLKTLWREHGSMMDDADEVVQRIKKSNIGNRFDKEMYIRLIKYLGAEFEENLWSRIQEDKAFDIFYIWVIKLCVIEQHGTLYSVYKDNFDMDTRISIINKLAKHDELLENENVFEWIKYIRYSTFLEQKCIPEKLDITLRTLLITNINVMVVAEYVCRNDCAYKDAFGTYLLIKVNELTAKYRKQIKIKMIVKSAFALCNKNVNGYLDMIERECAICKCEINYVQKEKMKEYLMQTF